MAVTFSEEKKEEQQQQQLAYLGLKPKVLKTAVVRLPGTESPDDEPAPKKKGSALPLVVGAAAIVFLLANK